MKIFAIYNMKGGVGKTSSCVNLAYLAAKEGHITLLWDLDPQAAATYYFEGKAKIKGGAKKMLRKRVQLSSYTHVTPYDRLDLIPADFSHRKFDLWLEEKKNSHLHFQKMLSRLKPDYNYIFIDCPPVIGLLAEHIFLAADYVLFPIIPTTLSMRAFEQVLHYFKKNNLDTDKIIPFFSMVDSRKRLHKQTIFNFRYPNIPILETQIPFSTFIERMGEYQAPLFTYSPSSIPAQAYRNLWSEIQQLA